HRSRWPSSRRKCRAASCRRECRAREHRVFRRACRNCRRTCRGCPVSVEENSRDCRACPERRNNSFNSIDRSERNYQMSLVIRMARAGTKKRPFYHIVLADSRSPRDGRFIERLGYYNPLLPKDKEERLKLDLDKVQAWMKKGAQPSDRVMRFLDKAGIAKRKPRSNPEKAVPRKERKAKAEEAAKAPAAGAPAA